MVTSEQNYAIPDPDIGIAAAPWLILTDPYQIPFQFAPGKNFYKPRHGIVNDLVSVFFVTIKGKVPDGRLIIENAPHADRRARQVSRTRMTVKSDLIFPCLKSRHIKKWLITPGAGIAYLIVPQMKEGKVNPELEVGNPEVYAYLSRYKVELRGAEFGPLPRETLLFGVFLGTIHLQTF